MVMYPQALPFTDVTAAAAGRWPTPISIPASNAEETIAAKIERPRAAKGDGIIMFLLAMVAMVAL
ncbi:MAG TPA: hypothetical protein VF711_13540 [Acidimicrobiales bacterium]